MVRRLYDKGYLYVLMASLCLILLFIGYNKVTNISKKDKINEEAKVVFNVIETENNNENEGLVFDNNIDDFNEEINIDNFFLKLLVNSNSYMKTSLQKMTGTTKSLGLGSYFIDTIVSLFKPQNYIKSHLPAFFNLVDVTQIGSGSHSEHLQYKNNSEDEINNVEVLEDILFVEDPDEAEEGEVMESSDENLEENEIEPPMTVKLDDKNPYVLIYHTHGTEAYLPIKENTYHTTKRRYNVLTIGEIIAKVLKDNGHKVKHVDIYHDIPSYSESYPRSLATVQEILKKEKSIKIVFDVHRDGVPENASYLEKAKKESKINVNGVDVATFSLVIGPENPNKDKILKFAQYIKSTSDKLYPGLCKGIIIKPYGKFNQFVCDYSALIEVGSNLNTIDEAKESAKLIGEVLNEVIKGISE